MAPISHATSPFNYRTQLSSNKFPDTYHTHSSSRSVAVEAGRSFLDLDSPTDSQGHDMPTPKLVSHGYSRSFTATTQMTSTFSPGPAVATPRPMNTDRALPPPPRALPSRPPLPPLSKPLPARPSVAPMSTFDAMMRRGVLVPLPAPNSIACAPARSSSRRLSVNTVRKLSARPLGSPASPSVTALSKPPPSPTSSDLPELTGDDTTEWEDDVPSSPIGNVVIHAAIRRAIATPMQLQPSSGKRRARVPPPLALVPPPRNGLVTASSESEDEGERADRVRQLSPSIRRRRASRSSRVSRRASVRRRDSVMSSVSGMPTFAATRGNGALELGLELPNEPPSPDLVYPMAQSNATMQEVRHVIETDKPMLGVSRVHPRSKALARLGLDAHDNVVVIEEGHDGRDVLTQLRELRLPPTPLPQKKSAFSANVRKFFGRRR